MGKEGHRCLQQGNRNPDHRIIIVSIPYMGKEENGKEYLCCICCVSIPYMGKEEQHLVAICNHTPKL